MWQGIRQPEKTKYNTFQVLTKMPLLPCSLPWFPASGISDHTSHLCPVFVVKVNTWLLHDAITYMSRKHPKHWTLTRYQALGRELRGMGRRGLLVSWPLGAESFGVNEICKLPKESDQGHRWEQENCGGSVKAGRVPWLGMWGCRIRRNSGRTWKLMKTF